MAMQVILNQEFIYQKAPKSNHVSLPIVHVCKKRGLIATAVLDLFILPMLLIRLRSRMGYTSTSNPDSGSIVVPLTQMTVTKRLIRC